MKLTDFVAQTLGDHGVKHVFGLTGGAVVHILDSFSKDPRITTIFHHHEQAAAFAAEANAKATNNLGVCAVTTGPGVTNTLTGLAAAWLDSVPCIFISGQARVAHTTVGKKIRQLGTQQLDVVPLVKPMTKYAVMVTVANNIKYELTKAIHIATSGRPGPVWIDIPLDLQWAQIEPNLLTEFIPEKISTFPSEEQINSVTALLEGAARPLLVLGAGIWRANATKIVSDLQSKLQIPVVTSWGAVDVIPHSNPLYLGCPGLAGNRGANLAVANADLILALGTHLCIPMTGTRLDQFATNSKIIIVDIDPDETEDREFPIELKINCDVASFLTKLTQKTITTSVDPEWLSLSKEYKKLNLPPEPEKEIISPYELVEAVSNNALAGDNIVVDGGGTNVYISYLTFSIKENQRFILSTGLCSMGSGLPEAIGVSMGKDRKRTIVFCGDGSFQLNIQELQTIKHHNLPIKIFISNNEGYLSIRQTQGGFLEGNYLGSSSVGGLTLPDYEKVVTAYGIPFIRITKRCDLNQSIQYAMNQEGPFVCEIITDPDQELIPRQGFEQQKDGSFSPRPLEDMAPFIERELFEKLMIAKKVRK
jgi:acetolactate synthase-1/2/3 large subunit